MLFLDLALNKSVISNHYIFYHTVIFRCKITVLSYPQNYNLKLGYAVWIINLKH